MSAKANVFPYLVLEITTVYKINTIYQMMYCQDKGKWLQTERELVQTRCYGEIFSL